MSRYYFWEKIKRNSFSSDFGPKALLFPFASQPAKPAHARRGLASGARWPSSVSWLGPAGRSPPRPGRNLGLGREFGLSSAPTWADFSPHQRRMIPTIHHHPTATSESRKIKTS
jgi:hypothetical protein